MKDPIAAGGDSRAIAKNIKSPLKNKYNVSMWFQSVVIRSENLLRWYFDCQISLPQNNINVSSSFLYKHSAELMEITTNRRRFKQV